MEPNNKYDRKKRALTVLMAFAVAVAVFPLLMESSDVSAATKEVGSVDELEAALASGETDISITRLITLDDAIEIKNGVKVTFSSDALSSTINGNIMVDNGGSLIVESKNNADQPMSVNGLIEIKNGAEMTINGNVTVKSGGSMRVYGTVTNEGTLNVNDGSNVTVYSTGKIDTTDGNLTIDTNSNVKVYARNGLVGADDVAKNNVKFITSWAEDTEDDDDWADDSEDEDMLPVAFAVGSIAALMILIMVWMSVSTKKE